jgi:hypothetical protein
MKLSLGLIGKCYDYKKSKAVQLGEYGNELKNYYQQTYNASVDLNCSGCIGRAMTRIIKDNEL